MNVLVTKQFGDNKYFVKPVDGILTNQEIFNVGVVPNVTDLILLLDHQLFTAHGMTQAGYRLDFFLGDMKIKTMEKAFKPAERVKGASTAFEEGSVMVVIVPVPEGMPGQDAVPLRAVLTLGGVGTKPESEVVMWFHQLIVMG